MVIERFLFDLRHALPGRNRASDRLLAEVEDHLHESARRLRESGLTASEAEAEAVRRFGPAAELARRHAVGAASLGLQRARRGVVAVLAALLVVLPTESGGGRAIGWLDPWSAAVSLVAVQVALVAGAVTLLRGLVPATGEAAIARLRLQQRGVAVTLAAAAAAGATEGASALAHAGTLRQSATGLAVAAALGLSLLVLLVALTASAGALRAALPEDEASGAAGPVGVAALAADATSTVHAVAAGRGLAATAARLLGGAIDGLSVVAGRLTVLRGLDPRRHAWRFGVAVAVVAGLAAAAGHGITDGGLERPASAADLLRRVIAGLMLLSMEGAAALLGFALLGGVLGLRPPLRWRRSS